MELLREEREEVAKIGQRDAKKTQDTLRQDVVTRRALRSREDTRSRLCLIKKILFLTELLKISFEF